MKNRYLLIVSFLCLFAISSLSVNGQQAGDAKIRVIAKVLAFDSYAGLSNITYAPQSLTLVLRVEKSLRGRERSKYIKCIYEYFGEDSTIVDLTSGGNQNWQLDISKDRSCDSTLRKEKYGRSMSVNGGKEVVFQRLKGLHGFSDLSENITLPCYILKKDGVKLTSKPS